MNLETQRERILENKKSNPLIIVKKQCPGVWVRAESKESSVGACSKESLKVKDKYTLKRTKYIDMKGIRISEINKAESKTYPLQMYNGMNENNSCQQNNSI